MTQPADERPGVPEPPARAAVRHLVARRPGLAVEAARVAARGGGALEARLLAAALREAGQGREAVEASRAALLAAPGDAGAWLSLARSQALVGDHAAAAATVERVLAGAPDHLGALLLRAEQALRDEPARAEALAAAAVRAAPRSAEARLLRSRALEHLGRSEEAAQARAAASAQDEALRESDASRRAALVFYLKLAAFALVAMLALGVVPQAAARLFPRLLPVATAAVMLLGPAIPLALVGWAAWWLRFGRLEPLDPDVAPVAEALGIPLEREKGRAP